MKWAFPICLLLVVATLCAIAILRLLRTETETAMKNAADTVSQLLQITPKVTMRSTVWPQKTERVLELATTSRSLPIEYTFEHTFLGSTKHLKLRGAYVVKAGFDLREAFSVNLSNNGHVAKADFPAPKILSVEMKHYEVVEDVDGWWNYLTQQDQQDAVAAMTGEIRKTAEQAGILAEARDSLTKQLSEIGNARGQQWQVKFRDGTSSAAATPEMALP